MSIHYNAFISYKHETEDIEVAKEIQRGLEYYNIPRKLRKEYGKGKINKVFRDKDELGLTNDLTDTIYNALDNSDHLIVICSTETKKSVWVQKEIEYFLKNHDKKDVFTVLVNGEPEDVIPDILMHDEAEETDEEGNVYRVDRNREMISCDYRLPVKRARKEELPRLVSAMIGCSYSELINRRRIHAIKQLSVILGVLFVFTALFVASLIRNAKLIKQSYYDALYDRSVQLSESATELFAQGDRVDALLLLLAAVPSEENPDIPVTAGAVKALTDLTYAYKISDPDAYSVMWDYYMSDNVFCMELSEDGSMIAVTNEFNKIKVWDTTTHKCLMEVDEDRFAEGIEFLPNGRLLSWNYSGTTVYDIKSGEPLYSIPAEYGLVSDCEVYVKDTSSFEVCTLDGLLCEYSLEDGSLIHEHLIAENVFLAFSMMPNEDNSFVALTVMNEDGAMDMLVYDTNTETSTKVFSSDRDLSRGYWANDHMLVFAELESEENSNQYEDAEYEIGENRYELHCYDVSKEEEVWTTSVCYNYPMLNQDVLVPEGTKKVACYVGNILAVYELETGKETMRCDLGDSVVSVNDVGDGNLNCFTRHGGFSTVDVTDSGAQHTIQFLFPRAVQQTISTENGLYMTQSNNVNVIYYEKGAFDDHLALYENAPEQEYFENKYMDDDVLVLVCGAADGKELYVYDLKDYNSFTVIPLPDSSEIVDVKIIGIYDGMVYVAYLEGDTITDGGSVMRTVTAANIYAVDYKTGEVNYADLGDGASDFMNINALALCENELVYPFINNEDETAGICVLDLATGDMRKFVCPYDAIDNLRYVRYDKDNHMIYCGGVSDVVIDLENERVNTVEYPDGWGGTSLAFEVYDGLVYVTDYNTVAAVDRNGIVVQQYKQPGYKAYNMCAFETADNRTEVLVFYDGFACRYDAESGEELGEFNVSYFTLYRSQLYRDSKNDTLYVWGKTNALVIDTKDWKEIAALSNTLGLDTDNKRFVVFTGNEDERGKVGYFDCYSADDLIQKAREITGDEQLSLELKADYSLDD